MDNTPDTDEATHQDQSVLEPKVPQPIDPDPRGTQRRVFLELIAEGSNIGEACAALGVNRSTVFRWRKDDPGFNAAVLRAFVANIEGLKREAERRAMKGSDKLLMFLLCNYAPDQFSNTQKLEHSGAVDLANAVLAARGRATPSGECPLV